MDEKLLKKANNLRNQMSYLEFDIRDIDMILEKGESMSSSIEFRENGSGWSRSFGSKKYGFKQELVAGVLLEVRSRLLTKLETLREQFAKL